MKAFRLLAMGAIVALLIITLLIFIFWISPLSIGLKLKIGNVRQIIYMLLNGADQLLRQRPEDAIAISEVINAKLNVGERQLKEAGRLVDRLANLAGEDPEVLGLRSRLELARGNRERAVEYLIKAKAIVVQNRPHEMFWPSPALLDVKIKDLRDQIAREEKERRVGNSRGTGSDLEK